MLRYLLFGECLSILPESRLLLLQSLQVSIKKIADRLPTGAMSHERFSCYWGKERLHMYR
jgi:hypothetical protein